MVIPLPWVFLNRLSPEFYSEQAELRSFLPGPVSGRLVQGFDRSNNKFVLRNFCLYNASEYPSVRREGLIFDFGPLVIANARIIGLMKSNEFYFLNTHL
jgi:hypothetical protein